ncbi:MAG: flagellar basal-body MS-ring/collar protein FliF [Planctomycetota bacterium]|jgi:flagellar M-ring protein FliF
MDFLQKLRAIWEKISLVQRALLTAIVLTFAIVGALAVHWARRPDMRMLYQELSPEEAAKITDKIGEQGISYELRGGGTAIYVPREQVYQLRLDMAKEGLPSGTQGGYKIFDDQKIGISPLVQSVNVGRALQEELAKSIQMLDGVVHARVHIVRSEQTVFTSEQGKTTASVVLRLRPGHKLSKVNVSAITHLVAGSIEGLVAENVTVINGQGQLLSGESDETFASGASTVQDYRERVEQNLATKAEDMLSMVLGPGRATVEVSAQVDMNSINIVTEKYAPKGVLVKEESTESKKEEPTDIGMTGGGGAEGGSTVASGTEKDSTTISEYMLSKTIETKVELPGKIESLSVAAFVDLWPADANAEQGGEAPAMIMEPSEVEEIIRNALGLKEADSLKVVNVKFHRAPELPIEEASNWPRYVAIARQASLGIMAVCALLVLRLFSGAKGKVKSELAAGAQSLPEGQGAAGLLPAGGENSEPLVMRRQIAHALQNNPEQVKQLFSSWLEEKGG